MTRKRAMAFLFLMVLFGACAYVGGRTTPFRPPPVAEPTGAGRGEELYLRDCAWCHGNQGQGTGVAPDLVTGTNGPALTHFMLTTGRMPLDFPEERMDRADPIYNEGEIDDIVDYVATFDQPGAPIPTVQLEQGDLDIGAELYAENCAACHSTSGIGGALASGRAAELPEVQVQRPANIAPGLEPSTPTEIAEAMLTGPGTMPVFGSQTITPEQLDSVVLYVTYLQHPDDRGGAGIGRVGPVAEGAIGWIVGMGLLLILIRWLGTKAGQQ
jgi:ubiquinol-cytochrome c reductase cytochrome c subunit